MDYPILLIPENIKQPEIQILQDIKGGTTGVSEKYFKKDIANLIMSNVQCDVKVGSYYPDFLVTTKKGYLVDVEIDEKYNLKSKEATHYLKEDGSHLDNYRNEYFLLNNIVVLRFAENQIINDKNGCARVINQVCELLDNGNLKQLDLTKKITPIKCWTIQEAEKSARMKERIPLLEQTGLFNSLVALAQGIDI